MRYVVLGAGAVGGVIGAHLHLAGLPVTLVARGKHLARIRAAGLVLDTAEGPRTLDVPAVGGADDVEWTDDTVVLLCVKSHQTAAALDDLEAHAPSATVVVSAQNGVTNEVEVLRRFAATYAICVMLPASHLEPGVVVQKCHPTPGILDIGRFPSGIDDLAAAIAADLRSAGFESVPRPDIMAWKHRKLLANAAGDVSVLFASGPEAIELARRVTAEGEAVLAAAGIPVVPAEDDAIRRDDVLRPRPHLDAHQGNSLAQSITRGLPTEIHLRIGQLVLLGRLHGVPTPASEQVLRAGVARSPK